MAARMKSWRTLRLLILFSLLSLTEHFEVRDDEWEELSPDIAALHRLRGLPEHMFHRRLQNHRNTSMHGARVQRSSREDIDQNPMILQDDLQECADSFTACVILMGQDFESFLTAIEDQKIQDWLLGASEISHSYSQKLLVMTDKEKSTNDRVQQEYSTDPHYSVIVSKECLDNVSCLPEADSNTVVKIFGSFSEDGQTVSGLSGSSLAALILKPPLEDAPVFSFNGNTTTSFQHNFMRVFVARGLKAVLETNQENYKMYQVMNQHDSVSGYRIPKRPVDHTTQYDHQQIVIMENDPIVRKAATYLYEKHPKVSSVYTLDENQRPKLIHGDSVPLSKESRLVLVGHTVRDSSGQTRLAGYRAEEVSKIIQQTFRVGDEIKTTSVVGCEVGSDKVFTETLLKDLHDSAGIKTELHLRDALVQVRHTGEKITLDITKGGLQWRHKDDSSKVVATLDRNKNLVIRDEPGSKGKAVFTNERNFLMRDSARQRFLKYRNNWPNEPTRFVDQKVFANFDQTIVQDVRNACDELEALSWGFFHEDLPLPEKVNTNSPQEIEGHYVIREKNLDHNGIRWIEHEQGLKDVLSNCYKIKSGKDVRNIIRHYAKTGENKPTYLMINDWIYGVDPETLYMYPYGKKLDNNQRENQAKIDEIKNCISEQIGKEAYPKIRQEIQKIEPYAQYVREIFRGEPTTTLPLSTEAWYTTYFAASVIAESARNFRTFPLVLMALDMTESPNNNVREQGLNFLFNDHSMASGLTWIDPSSRGYSGSATPTGSSKLQNKPENRPTEGQLMQSLKKVIAKEFKQYQSWTKIEGQNIQPQILRIAERYMVTETNTPEQQSIINDYNAFKTELEGSSVPSESGILGGYNDGHTTSQDLKSATELEISFKLESFFSRLKVLSAEEVHNQLKTRFGENLAGLRLQDGKLENGELIGRLVSDSGGAEPVEFKFKLSPETQRYNEKMLSGLHTGVRDLEIHGSASSHGVSKHVERTGTAVGMMGLMLGMKGAVRAFEQGDIKDGVIGTLQSAHAVTAMTTSLIAKQTLTSEARISRAVATFMKSPAMKGTMAVLPIVGIGFGVYNFAEDVKRGDALGYFDAALDGTMVALDILELVQPELAPFIAPINLVLSVVRMISDDVYMSIKEELNSLPEDAGILRRLLAVPVGFLKGLKHFAIHVASFFYDWHYDEIEYGHKLVEQISDYSKYYKTTKEKDGTMAIDFTRGDSSWNGGGIEFCLADQGPSELCMNYVVSDDNTKSKHCWSIDTHGSKDIILGLGESHQYEYKRLQKTVLVCIPAGYVTVISGYEAIPESRYGIYTGNGDSNNFFAVQTAKDPNVIELMLTYYYKLYGEPGDDVFFLGPQRSYVRGSSGKDTYLIPKNGGTTIINNYDLSKALDTLHFSVDYSHISVYKSADDVVLMYEGSHTVLIEGWFLGDVYRHMNMMSGDGVLFEISSTVISSVQLVAKGINKMFMTHGVTVTATQPFFISVTSIFGSRYDDVLIGNGEKNLIDGGGGRDRLYGGEEEDIYIVKSRQQSSVLIDNYSIDTKTDLAMIEANLHTFRVSVEGDNVVLNAFHNNTAIHVTLENWFRSPADRHLLVVTKDLITFAISDKKADCQLSDLFKRCIKSRSIDYSSSPIPLVVDLQQDEAFDSVTEVRGSKFNDHIRGNKEHNVIIPGGGNDFLQGRAGEDWYIITSGQGVKIINNHSPDLVLDILYLKDAYQHIACTCEGQNIEIYVRFMKSVILQNWFNSKTHQHLHIKTSDGVTAELITDISSCDKSVILPITVDYRNQRPEPLTSVQTSPQISIFLIVHFSETTFSSVRNGCFIYRGQNSEERPFCGWQGKVMMMNYFDSVKEMYGSSGFDIMVGNNNENLLDPYKEGALMFGGEGKDTYVIKHGYGNNIIIDNFAEDQNIDTVLVDMDFLDGSQVTLDSSTTDLLVMIMTKGEQFQFSLLNYNNGVQHQHLEFESSDGVRFKLNSLNSAGDVPLYHIEAFKVTLKQLQVDCRLDLGSYKNLSKVLTVQGCVSQSNDLQGNAQNNALMGGWKDDALQGHEGDDTLIGGGGADILIGDSGDDTLYGGDGNDTMIGDSGRDIFIPGPGSDQMDGGPGKDTVLYQGDHNTGKGVYVNLLTGQGLFADAEGDVLKDVEIVIGTIYSDILVAGYESSLLKGSDGNDILVSTGGDYLVGDDGNDIYILAFHNGSVTINNCAKDGATDILYLSSRSTPVYDYQRLSDRVVLTFFEHNQITLTVTVDNWTSDGSECGHLHVVYGGLDLSLDRLLQKCRRKGFD